MKLQKRSSNISIMYDRTLLWLMLGLSAIGFIMVISTSMPIGFRLANDPFLFVKRDTLYIIFSFSLAKNTLCLPMKFWQRCSCIMLVISIIMLIIVSIAGSSLNGASRWIILGPIRIQPSEFTKFSFFCYLSRYIAEKIEEVRNDFSSLLKPIAIILIMAVFLLMQPDLGTIIILLVTTLGMFFLAGAKLKQLIAIICIGIFSIILLIFSKAYRIHRVTSFLNPWKDAFGGGYQLTQSLMAFGRGEFWGQGLGNSVHKMEYLPEAHTDFIFSVLGEELGYIGVVLSLLMVFSISLRAMTIGRNALMIGLYFSGLLSCSIGIWFSFQTLINVGSVTGMLPTKGLTFPLISYGGSSLLVMSNAIIILIRTDHEIRLKGVQATRGL